MTTFYVAKSGSNHAAGTKADPFRTIGRALDERPGAGDTVIVKAGTYRENVWIANGGDRDDYFTLRSEVKGGAVIDASGDPARSGIQIADDFVRVWGFDVRDSTRSGISATGVEGLAIVANEARDNDRCGIYIGRGDDVRIIGNETHHNASSGPYSGISVHRPEGDGVILIRDNISHHNMTDKKPGKANTDGHGFILDDGRATKYPDQAGYDGRFVVENNLAHHNGGAGFLVFRTDRVRLEDNTAAHNNLDPTRKAVKGMGEIELRESNNVTVRDNVAVADDDFAFSIRSPVGHRSKDVVWDGNFAWNETTGRALIFVSDGEKNPKWALNHFGIDPVLDDHFGFHAAGHDAGWHW